MRARVRVSRHAFVCACVCRETANRARATEVKLIQVGESRIAVRLSFEFKLYFTE